MNEGGSQKLEMLGLVDDTIRLLEGNKRLYQKTAASIVEGLYPIFQARKVDIIGINSRIKSPLSLREKIVRNKLYKRFSSPQAILDNLSDPLGIMIECRFIANEPLILDTLRQHFYMRDELGYSYIEEFPGIFLDLASQQPQNQKNGQEAYRIDGFFLSEGQRVNFELQIKSLVNTFWSEVEHKIIYKNNTYIPNDSYIKEMLLAIRSNLSGLDKMLQLVNDQIDALSSNVVVRDVDFDYIIAKAISDLFNQKMEESIGFTVDFRKVCDLLSQYIVTRYDELPVDTLQAAFIDLSNRFSEIYYRTISLEENVCLDGEFLAEDTFSRILGEKLLRLMNMDFEWHIFFVMLFQIESDTSKLESFQGFISMLRGKYADPPIYKALYEHFDGADALRIHDELLGYIGEVLAQVSDDGVIFGDVHDKVLDSVSHLVRYVSSFYSGYEQWVDKRDILREMLLDSLR